MRFIWLVFLLLAGLIGGLSWWQRPTADASSPAAILLSAGGGRPGPATDSAAARLVRFALHQLGVPYRWAGTTPEGGFDCSGFLLFAYAHVGVAVPHSTALLIDAGQPVPRTAARPGDLLVFTGTAAGSTTPGHAGIVISEMGEVPLRFVHASSARRESGVKVSQVEGTDYERRFLQVRRVLPDDGPRPGAARPTGARPAVALSRARVVAIVAPLEQRPAAVQLADDAEPPLPARVAPLVLVRRPVAAARRPVSRSKSVKALRPKTTSKITGKTIKKASAAGSSRHKVAPAPRSGGKATRQTPKGRTAPRRRQ